MLRHHQTAERETETVTNKNGRKYIRREQGYVQKQVPRHRKCEGLVDTPESERLASAITQHIETHSLVIRYRAETGSITERVVTPLSLMKPIKRSRFAEYENNRPWTLLAWCHKKEALRCFFLTRVLCVDPVERRHVTITQIVNAVANGNPANILRLRDDMTPKQQRRFLDRFDTF